jgi:hypothetical protein
MLEFDTSKTQPPTAKSFSVFTQESLIYTILTTEGFKTVTKGV